MKGIRAGIIIVVVLAAGTVAAAPAHATTLYAHPDGGGGPPCTQSQPPEFAICSIGIASVVATSGDEIVLLPDTVGGDPYGPLLEDLNVPNGVVMRGPSPGSPALVTSNGGNFHPIDVGTGSALQDVRLVVGNLGAPNLGLEASAGSRIERVRVEAKFASLACRLNGAGIVVRDTVCWTGQNNARALEAVAGGGSVTLRNVTAWNFVVGGTGIRAVGGTQMFATNVVAQGDDDGSNRDVAAAGDDQTSITIDHSNFSSSTVLNGATIVNAGGNTTGAPAFVADELGDFTQQPTSTSTIDMGAVAPVNGVGLGSFDAFGGPRCAGSAPDIGADEFAGVACPVAAPDPGPQPQPKRCKKGKKLKKGKCVKKKRKKRR